MRYAVAALITGLALTAPARAEMPDYDVAAYCKRVGAAVGGSSEIENACLQQEQAAYDGLKPNWDGLPATMRAYCDKVARSVGAGFEILNACVQQELQADTSKQQFKFKR